MKRIAKWIGISFGACLVLAIAGAIINGGNKGAATPTPATVARSSEPSLPAISPQPGASAIEAVTVDIKSVVATSVAATVQAAPAASSVATAVAGVPGAPVAPTAAPAQAPVAKQGANLRGGPGTSYPIVGGVKVGSELAITHRNAAGDWYRLTDDSWIVASAVDGAPANLPVITPAPLPTNAPVPTKALPTRAPAPQVASFGSGMQVVGADITPATYRSMGGDSCYWERLSGFGGTLDEIVANENAAGPTVVTIAATDKGFSSTRCSRWSQDLSPITSSPTAPFGDGVFIVNKDIAPGTWRSSGGDGCYWARLAGFSGELDHIIANDNVSGPTVVTVGAADAGFTSTRCGTWNKVGQ
jgi:hypothetical protein